MDSINYTTQRGESQVEPAENAVSLADCTKLYLWMAKCCPQLTKLRLYYCYGTHYTNMIPMLHALPALKDFTYRILWVTSDLLLANSPESAATFRDIVPLSDIEGINEDKQCHLPHITTLNIYIDNYQLWMIKQVLEIMFQGCDLRELQTLSLSLSDAAPPDRLLQYLLLHGHHLKSICLDIEDANTSPLWLLFANIAHHWNTGN